ncbi:CGG triplet repeat-binding 1 [Labeo rohita]|uniref:CGG triplet repeat-binding 1 n=1 Tax=Labeo rohita TaxID=84645 RepID=A0A498LZN8_LABRO|nr:CGG triplet repeat-binding 1 [Labeo rohita]
MSVQEPTRQVTITEAVARKSIASSERNKICEDWVATCTALNIPLSKSDHPAMRKFLFENVTNGGAIPGFHQLQEKYLGNVYLKEKEALRKRLAKKPIAVIFDETPDVEGRCVLNILIAPLEKDESGRILAYLADTVFLEQCNHSTVSVSVVKCLQEYDIANEDVIVFDTDNAAYMKKAYTAALQSLFPNSLHVTCMAHIMNLIGDAFRRPFDQLNSFMLSFSQMFYHAGSRKSRYLQFMSGKHPTRQKATMAPNPCATRWNSWFKAVQYHSEHFKLYKEFIEMEIKVSGSSAPQSVERLHEMLQNEDMAQCLQMNFTANKELQYESCAEHFEGLDVHHATKTHILNLVHLAYSNAEEKLTKYMSEGQPAINFLREVRVFDPRYISFMENSVSGYTHIPGFSAVPNDEFDAYFQRLGPAALKASACGVVDLDVFWDGLLERRPVLSALAKRYKDVIVNSADAERSNSLYKLVLSSRRRSITNSNLKALVFLYHNQRLTSGVFERDELEIDCGPDSEDEVEDSLDT